MGWWKEDTSLYNFWKSLKEKLKNIEHSDDFPLDISNETLNNNIINESNINFDDILGESDLLTFEVENETTSVAEKEPVSEMINISQPNINFTKSYQFPEKENRDTNIPTSFRKNLFWPEPCLKNTNKKAKHRISAVATSDQWINFYKNKKAEKESVLAKKEEKKKMKRKNTKVSAKHSSYAINDFVMVMCDGKEFPGIVVNE